MLLSSLAFAGPIFLSTGAETQLDVNGNWPRPFAAEDGWHMFNASAGDFHYQLVNDDLTTDRSSRLDLTGRTNLQDHAISPCPDGTWLHVATASTLEDNDSSYAFRYDADFSLIAESTIAEGDTSAVFVDIPAICDDLFQGMGYWAEDENVPLRLVALDDDLAVTGTTDMQGCSESLGSALMVDENVLYTINFSAKDEDSLCVAAYDPSLVPIQEYEVDVTEDGWTGYWSQGATRVGDTYLVAHMASDDDFTWSTQQGDLFIAAFDLDWNHLDEMQLSYNVAPNGGMQPGLAFKDDTLLVVYSRDLQNWAFEVTIDLVAAGVEEEDTGVDTGGHEDTAPPPDTGGDTAPAPDTDTAVTDSSVPYDSGDPPADPPDDDEDCGCGSPGLGMTLFPGVLLALARRRR